MLTREAAIERAVEYLGRRFRGRLEVHEGWPGEAEHDDRVEPGDDSSATIEGWPKRVWRVLVMDDVARHVGADLYLIIDADTGRVFREMHWGE